MEKLIANKQQHELADHLIGVLKRSLQIVDEKKFDEGIIKKSIINIIVYGALLHDIGKVHSLFQDYINKLISKKNNEHEDTMNDAESERKETFKGPFHNEISFALFAKYFKLDNEEIFKCVSGIIYWHHPANTDKYSNKLIYNTYDEIFDEANKSDPNLENNLLDFWEKLKKEVSNYDFFQEYKDIFDRPALYSNPFIPKYINTKNSIETESLKLLTLQILIAADRDISELTSKSLKLYLNNKFNFDDKIEKKSKFNLKEILKNDLRTNEQYNLAQKISENDISVLATDPASGKTRISLFWHILNCQKENRKLFFALSRQIQVKSLEETLKEDLESILINSNDISIEGIFSGKKQYSVNNDGKKEDLLTSDLIVMVFDRLLSPCYKRKQYDEFILALNSDLVIDEFHEFGTLYKMIFPLQMIIRIRSWLNNGAKTLFLSGTPDPGLVRLLFGGFENKFKFNLFSRDSLSPVNLTKTYVSYSSKFPEKIEKDTLVSFNTIDQIHEHMVNSEIDLENSFYISSYFNEADKLSKMEEICNANLDKLSDMITLSSKMFSGGVGTKFKNGILKSTHPNSMAQTNERINRKDDKPNGHIQIIEEQDLSIFNDNKLGHKKLIIKYNKFLKISLPEKKLYTRRERMVELYDKFWLDEENILLSHMFIEEQVKKNSKKLDHWFPTRHQYYRSKNSEELKIIIPSEGFRDQGVLVTAAVYNNEGECIGQLNGIRVVNFNKHLVIEGLIDAYKFLTKKEIKKLREMDIGIENPRLSKRTLGKRQDNPLIVSLMFENSKINKELKNINSHYIYNEYLGLIRKDIFDKLVHKLPQKKT